MEPNSTGRGNLADSTVEGDIGSRPSVGLLTGGEVPDELVSRDEVVGQGAQAAEGSTVTMHYVLFSGTTGEKVDSSWDRGQPFSSALSRGRLIDGWIEGVPGMKVGGRRVLVIPPHLGYGANGVPGIPPNDTLLFVIDLVDVR